MADISDTLKSLLGDGAEDKIKGALESFSQDSGDDNKPVSAGSMGDIMQLRNMIEAMTVNRNDPRTNLLMSLKPYMSEQRKQGIESAVKLMGIMNIIKLLGK